MSLSAQDKVQLYIHKHGIDAVENLLYDFLYSVDLHEKLDDYKIEMDGSIYWRLKGRYVTDGELEEFVEFCEKENA